MSLTPAAFRAAHPEFADGSRYPDAIITSRIYIGARLVNEERWGELTDHGVGLVVAHYTALQAAEMAAADAGRAPGVSAGGVLSSKSGGGVSASYDVSSVTEKDAGFWNATSYGREFFRLSRLHGAGPLQVI